MTTDLYALIAVGALALALGYVPGISRMQRGGLGWGFGNRDAPPGEDPEWVRRSERAQRNLLENLPLFTILVLVAHVAHESDEVTAIASLAYLVARVAHAIVYIAGVTFVRTVVFYAGIAAELAIAARILD